MEIRGWQEQRAKAMLTGLGWGQGLHWETDKRLMMLRRLCLCFVHILRLCGLASKVEVI